MVELRVEVQGCNSDFRWTWLKVLDSFFSGSLRRKGLAGNRDFVIISLVMVIETLTVEKFAKSEWWIGKRITSEG